MYLIGTRIHISITLNNTNGDYTPISAIWIIHAIADTSRILIPSLAFLLHPYTWKSMHNTLSQSHSTLRHPEMSEYSENNLVEVSPVFNSNPEENDICICQDLRLFTGSMETILKHGLYILVLVMSSTFLSVMCHDLAIKKSHVYFKSVI